MSSSKNPYLERGTTFYAGRTIDTNNYEGVNLEGKEYETEDFDLSSSTPKLRTKHMVTIRLVRNISGITLLGKRLAALSKADTKDLPNRVIGYASTTAEGPVFPIDEWLPAAGVPNGDLFWIVVDGPATVLSDIAALTSIAVGDWLVSLTGATTGATTSGRVQLQDLTGATALVGNQIQHRIGRALSAKTTANTASDLLALITKW